MPEWLPYDELPVRAVAPPGSSWGLWGDPDFLGCLDLLTQERAASDTRICPVSSGFSRDGLRRAFWDSRPRLTRDPSRLFCRAGTNLTLRLAVATSHIPMPKTDECLVQVVDADFTRWFGTRRQPAQRGDWRRVAHVPERTDTLLAGQYFLAVQGYAMMRSCLTEPSSTRPRVDDVRAIVANLAEFPHSLEIPMTEHDVESGYTRWSARYDRPNPAIATEEPIVHAMLDRIPPGVALDAACGTGRHAARLDELGHTVIGVDATEAMLVVARAKVPTADFREGRLEALPVDAASVDLVTCSLALTHVADLQPVMRELARVLRPGGTVVLSDMHPMTTMTGGIAGFPEGDITKGIPYVRNLTHQISEYVAAFNAAGLTIRECIEPTIGEDMLAMFPSFTLFPDATRQAFLDTPYLLIWRLEGGTAPGATPQESRG